LALEATHKIEPRNANKNYFSEKEGVVLVNVKKFVTRPTSGK
jgi:hypothetical protein